MYNAYSEGVVVKHATKYYRYKAASEYINMNPANTPPGDTSTAVDLNAWAEINYKAPMVIDFAGRMTDGVITGATIIDCGSF